MLPTAIRMCSKNDHSGAIQKNDTTY